MGDMEKSSENQLKSSKHALEFNEDISQYCVPQCPVSAVAE
jgi:hypothetical protein